MLATIIFLHKTSTELVHVLQWQYLGSQNFIQRYLSEMQEYGYNDAPLEKMAYGLQGHYSSNGVPIDVPSFVRQNL